MTTSIRRALLSVSDKSRLIELAAALDEAGVEIVSTGSTAATIAAQGIPVTAVEEVTNFPECFDGRVKTLHPKIHGGILSDRRKESHRTQLSELDIQPFDLVVVNLYPFKETVASGAGIDECIENIDIGGPAMVRAAAKNHASVAIVTSPEQYPLVIDAVRAGGFSDEQRGALAKAAFQMTASYDVAVASWLGGDEEFPQWLGRTWNKVDDLRYGENSHQSAALYGGAGHGLAQAVLLHGKPMSFNNYVDADAAYRTAYDFDEPCVAIIKHANPCGVAVGETIAQAHARAHACDPLSAFGGVIATNRPVSVEMATAVKDIFTEVIVAPGFDDDALEMLRAKKNLRLLVAPAWQASSVLVREISGGALVQQPDNLDAPGDMPTAWDLVAGPGVDDKTLADLQFAWKACRAVKSNAIVLAHEGATVGVGMGQVNRVDSCKLAVERAGDRATGAVAASDAFFPFPDGPKILIDAGVRAIVQPGGSLRDEQTIQACQDAGISLYFTHTRHFFH